MLHDGGDAAPLLVRSKNARYETVNEKNGTLMYKTRLQKRFLGDFGCHRCAWSTILDTTKQSFAVGGVDVREKSCCTPPSSIMAKNRKMTAAKTAD